MENVITILGIISIIFITISYFVGEFLSNFLLFFSFTVTALFYFSNPNIIIRFACIYSIVTIVIHYLL